jgi:endonuclease YncB( thermonuclease family)
MARTFRWLATLLLLAGPLWAAQEFTGTVVRILDGDTLDVLVGGSTVRVRLAGIDCPERGQPFGRIAKQFVLDRAAGRDVRVSGAGRDRYDRVIGEVALPDGRSLNRELVRAGLAWWYHAYSKDTSLGRLEAESRAARSGLWSDSDPVAPWDFRRAKRSRKQ